MLQGDTKLKLEDALYSKSKVHYALQFGKTQHIICIYPQRIDTGTSRISCKIIKCECVNDKNDETYDDTIGIMLTPKAAEAKRLKSYRCNYYSNSSLLLKRSQIVYRCGCSMGMYDVLEERLKSAMEEK